MKQNFYRKGHYQFHFHTIERKVQSYFQQLRNWPHWPGNQIIGVLTRSFLVKGLHLIGIFCLSILARAWDDHRKLKDKVRWRDPQWPILVYARKMRYVPLRTYAHAQIKFLVARIFDRAAEDRSFTSSLPCRCLWYVLTFERRDKNWVWVISTFRVNP